MSPWKMALPALIVGPVTYLVTVGVIFAIRRWRAHNDAVTEGAKPCA